MFNIKLEKFFGKSKIFSKLIFLKKESFAIALIAALIAAFVVLIVSFTIQGYILREKAENKILMIDEYNLGVACLILKSIKETGGMPVQQYNTAVYEQNLSFIFDCHRDTEIFILSNISMMSTSNKMMEGNFFGYTDINKSEIQEKISKLAKDIIKNIKSYDVRVSEIECEY